MEGRTGQDTAHSPTSRTLLASAASSQRRAHPGDLLWPLAAPRQACRGMLRRAVFSGVQRKDGERMFQSRSHQQAGPQEAGGQVGLERLTGEGGLPVAPPARHGPNGRGSQKPFRSQCTDAGQD